MLDRFPVCLWTKINHFYLNGRIEREFIVIGEIRFVFYFLKKNEKKISSLFFITYFSKPGCHKRFMLFQNYSRNRCILIFWLRLSQIPRSPVFFYENCKFKSPTNLHTKKQNKISSLFFTLHFLKPCCYKRFIRFQSQSRSCCVSLFRLWLSWLYSFTKIEKIYWL